MEAVLGGASLAVSSSLSILIRAAITEMTTGPIKIPIKAFAAAEKLMRDYEFGQSEEDLGRISGFPIRTLGSRITETLP